MATTTNDDYKGYRGAALNMLKKFSARVWSEVEVETTHGNYSGIVLPRSETCDDRHFVIKLCTGYNIGLAVDCVEKMREIGRKVANYKIPEKQFPFTEGLPKVTLLGTGGTIASRLDYRTGAVIPAFSPGELYGAVPELANYCNMTTRKLYGVFSENMGPEQYIGTAHAIKEAIDGGADGIIIGHGTDTMHHTAAILTFMVQNLPVPVILVGSQRSSDRPSSDAARNLINATKSAGTGDIAEVMVCMFGPTSDQYCLLHRGTRVRKMHSSYRSTFRTIGDIPLARVSPDSIEYLKTEYNHRDRSKQVKVFPYFEERVAMIYYYPNMNPDMVTSLVDNGYKGIIIVGTGLGHVNRALNAPLKKAIEAGVHIFMTVQTLWGFVQMYVYDTGRDLMELGVIPAANMLPEVAYMKLCWTLGQTNDREEVKRIMLTPVCGETTDGEPHDGYVILQGGLPETKEILQKYKK